MADQSNATVMHGMSVTWEVDNENDVRVYTCPNELWTLERAGKEWSMFYLSRTDLLRMLEATTNVDCDHDWKDPSNEVVDANGYQWCFKCGAVRSWTGGDDNDEA